MLCVAPNPARDATLVVDELTPGAIHRPREVVRLPGGKGVNVARAATALGAEARVAAMVPAGDLDWFTAELAAEGIALVGTETTGSLRCCSSIFDASAGTLTELYERGSDPGAETWARFAARVSAEIKADEPLVFAGSLPPGVEPGALAELAAAAVTSGTEVVIDTSGPALAAMAGLPAALVKVNEREASELVGCAAPGADDAAAAALAGAVRTTLAEEATVVVTRGGRGAVLSAPGCLLAVSLPGPPGNYPVGSGDAFLAGLLHARATGADLGLQLAAATAAGAANAAAIGAGRLDPELAKRLRDAVLITEAA